MVKVKEDLTGMTFGRLKVIEQVEDHITKSGKHEAQWLCECSCENHTRIKVIGNSLRHGHTKSCGCLMHIICSEVNKKYNKYSDKMSDEYGDYYIGWTTNTNKKFYIDAEDYDKIKDFTWIEHKPQKNFSILKAHVSGTRRYIKMHVLLGYKGYDHIDHNELNNRRYNLRPATHQENQCNMRKRSDNTSGVTGVVWSKQRQKWIAQIQYKGKMYNLGGFINKDEAIYTRLQAENKYFGKFAPQQNLFKKYNINTTQNDFNKESEK